MKSIRNFGEHESKDFYHPILGYNCKMTDIQAAIGLVQLSKIEKFIDRRRENVAELNERLKDHEWIKSLPSELSYGRSVYFSYIDAFNRGFYISNSPALTREEKEFIIDSFKKVLSSQCG